MEGESGLEILTGAIVYPFTSSRRLFTGGIVGLLSMILIGAPFLMGYQVRCGRNILEGNDDLPGWEDPDKLFFDGIFAIVIVLLYGIVTIGVTYGMFLVALFAGIAVLEGSALLMFMIALMIIIFLVSLPLSILSQISLMNFIYSEDLGTGLNPINSLRLLTARPFEFVKALILDYVANIVIAIPYVVVFFLAAIVLRGDAICLLFILLLLSIGWMVFIQNSVRMFIWIKFFDRVVEKGPDTSFDPSLVA